MWNFGKEAGCDVKCKFNDLELLCAHDVPFDKAKQMIEKAGGMVATAQQVVQAALLEKIHACDFATNSNFTAENIIVPLDGNMYVTLKDNSPLLKYAGDATKAGKDGKEFYISKSELEKIISIANEDASKPASQRRIYLIKEKIKDGYAASIPAELAERFEFLQFLFKGDLPKYAEMLKSAGLFKNQGLPVSLSFPSSLERDPRIGEEIQQAAKGMGVPVYTDSPMKGKQLDKAFVRPMQFTAISYFCGVTMAQPTIEFPDVYDRYHPNEIGVFGVRKAEGKASA